MHIDIKDGAIAWRGLLGATLFGMAAAHLTIALLGLFVGPPYMQALTQRWVWLWAFPVVYGLVHATTSRPSVATLSQLASTTQTLNAIALWAQQHGSKAMAQPPRTIYISTSKLRRMVNRCFGVFMWVEVDADTITVGSNRNMLRFLLQTLQRTHAES